MRKLLIVSALAFAMAIPAIKAEAIVPCPPPATGYAPIGLTAGGGAAVGVGATLVYLIGTNTQFPLCNGQNDWTHAGPGILPVADCEHNYPDSNRVWKSH